MAPLSDTRIRVLHLGSPTGLYGAERWILALARYLPPERVESWVGVIKDDPDIDVPLCRVAAELGFPTREFTAYGRLSIGAIAQIRRFIRENSISVIHTHGYKTDVIGYLAAKGTTCRIMATPHGWRATPGIRLRLYEMLDRLVLQLVDSVVPLSSAMYEELYRRRRMRKRLHLVPNGVDLAEVDACGPSPGLLQSRRAAGDLIIGYIGRLDRGKRLDTLIRAFSELPFERKYLCIVGEGPERVNLEKFAAELRLAGSVCFLGFREDRISLLQGFDLFVLCSESEGLPRCLMEAMAAGIPVVASDIPGCRAIVEDDMTGLLFPTGDYVALASRMTVLLKESDLRRELAWRGREHVRRNFSAEAMAVRYVDLYQDLVDECGRGPAETSDSVGWQ